jgi:flavodoxin
MESMRTRIKDRLAGSSAPSEEDDVSLTTDQAAQLKYVYDNLKVASWLYKGGDDPRDMHQVVKDIDHNVKQVSLDTANLDTYGLTTEQVGTLAGLLATNTTLADAIAERVADKLALRLSE